MGEYLEQQYDEREYALELAKKHNLLPEGNSKMTWEELKEKAKKMGYKLDKYYTEYFSKDIEEDGFKIRFDEYGNVIVSYDKGICIANVTMAEHRTPDQMLAIMKALQ